MEMFLLVAVCSLLVSSSKAQATCGSITASELGNTDTPSLTGLIAESVGVAVQLVRFRVACEVTGGRRDVFTQVSVVVEYIEESTPAQAQIEFSCSSGQWTSISQSAFTQPPDIDNILFTVRRRDCYSCVSPNMFGSSAPGNNHCLSCSSACFGLDQCTSASGSDCCNLYDQNGICTLSCQAPFQPLQDNTCGCRPGFMGPQCNDPICNPNTCMNFGTCSFSGSDFSCVCPPEFTGVRCETALNPCTATSCANGGTCTPLAGVGGGFECNCLDSFDGNTCQNNVNECIATPSPCLNGGTCTDNFGSYTCSCQGQWEGQNCETCGIANCTVCSTDGTSCMECIPGLFGATCSPLPRTPRCTLESCEVCSTENLVCERCESGFIVGLNSLCVRGTSRDINLTDIEIIAIIIGCTIGFIMILTLLTCCLVWTCKGICKRGPEYIKNQKSKKKIIRKKKSRTEMHKESMVNKDMEGDVENEEGDLTLF